MGDKHRLRALSDVLRVRSLEQRVARFALAVAAADEARAETDVATDRAFVEAALTDWSDHLRLNAVDQDDLRRFAQHAANRESALTVAQHHLAQAARQREEAGRAHREANARAYQAATLLRSLLRRGRRRLDEKALQALEDRITHDHCEAP